MRKEHARLALTASGLAEETIAELKTAIARAEERAAAGIRW